VKKHGIFRPVGGGISCRVNDRVTRVINRTYAVRPIPAWCRTRTPASPAAAWYCLIFVYKNLHKVQTVPCCRPAGSENAFWVSNRVTRVNNYTCTIE